MDNDHVDHVDHVDRDDHVDNVDRDDHVDHDVEGESGGCAWKVAGSCSKEERLLIPPTISNSGVGGPR